jgi:uncharacterized membrane protein
MPNMIAVTFPEQSKAYQALSVLRDADAAGRIKVLGAALVERDASGALRMPESTHNVAGAATAGGGLVGLLIGVLGGPLGMLLGWSTGTLVGSTVDIERADTRGILIEEYARAVPTGSTALVAEVEEPAVEVIDGEMAKLGGTVLRRPAEEVLAELEAAEEAAAAAEREARKELREKKKADRKEKYEERKTKLKEKLGLG